MRRIVLLAAAVALAIVVGGTVRHDAVTADDQPGTRVLSLAEQRTEWIATSLKEMQTIKVGMTREQFMKVFTEEGGLSTPKERTYVYRDCPYIKVDVEFTIVGRPETDSDGRLTSETSPKDTIRRISKPYLDWSIMD